MVYRIPLGIHSWNRWIVIILGLILLVTAWKNWLGHAGDSASTNRTSTWFIISIDIQLLLGVFLLFVSPTIASFMNDLGGSMGQPTIRFWSLEHTTMMLIATAIAHVGRVKVKKAPDADAANRRGAIWFSVSYAMILLAIPWPFLSWGRPLFFL